jgi:hypothetical protein
MFQLNRNYQPDKRVTIGRGMKSQSRNGILIDNIIDGGNVVHHSATTCCSFLSLSPHRKYVNRGKKLESVSRAQSVHFVCSITDLVDYKRFFFFSNRSFVGYALFFSLKIVGEK